MYGLLKKLEDCCKPFRFFALTRASPAYRQNLVAADDFLGLPTSTNQAFPSPIFCCFPPFVAVPAWAVAVVQTAMKELKSVQPLHTESNFLKHSYHPTTHHPRPTTLGTRRVNNNL